MNWHKAETSLADSKKELKRSQHSQHRVSPHNPITRSLESGQGVGAESNLIGGRPQRTLYTELSLSRHHPGGGLRMNNASLHSNPKKQLKRMTKMERIVRLTKRSNTHKQLVAEPPTGSPPEDECIIKINSSMSHLEKVEPLHSFHQSRSKRRTNISSIVKPKPDPVPRHQQATL